MLAASSTIVFALLDTATIARRFSGEPVTGRPMLLHTFSIAVITCAVVAHALWYDTTAHTTATRVAYFATAAGNATVPVLGLRHDELRIAVPLVHLALVGLLLAMAILAGRQATDLG